MPYRRTELDYLPDALPDDYTQGNPIKHATAVQRPDFFIVGAQRSGTTAMDTYLGVHPDIFMCRPKEPHHFCTDLANPVDRFVRSREEYLSLFKDAEAKRVGESSPFYLYSRHAASNIKEFCPHASIIIMLRNPVDFMYSLYNERFFYNHLRRGHEDLPTFEEALSSEEDRKQGRRLPRQNPQIPSLNFHLFYREHARFAEQAGRYFALFPRDSIHVILFDDFVKDPAKTYETLCDFLGVDTRFKPPFARINANKTVQNHLVLRFLGESGAPWRRVARKAFPHRLRRRIVDRLYRIGMRSGSPAPMRPETREMLKKEFLPEVERLSQIIGRDVTHWCR